MGGNWSKWWRKRQDRWLGPSFWETTSQRPANGRQDSSRIYWSGAGDRSDETDDETQVQGRNGIVR